MIHSNLLTKFSKTQRRILLPEFVNQFFLFLLALRFVINFFLARTSILQKHPWDSELKVREHEEFFWRLKQKGVKITHTQQVAIEHYPDSDIEDTAGEFYKMRTLRLRHYHQLACRKIGVNDFKILGDMYEEPWSLYYFVGRNLKRLEANQDNNIFLKVLYRIYSFIKTALYALKRLLIKLGILIRTQ